VLVSANVRDFVALVRTWADQDRHHAGLILVPRSALSVGQLLRRLIAQCRTWDASQRDQVVFLSPQRHVT
jgi:hypothetical protein